MKLLLEAGAKTNAEDELGSNALWLVENPKVVKILLEHGVNPNKADNIGKTPLHGAAMYGMYSAYDILVKGGADPAVKDQEGKTPLDVLRAWKGFWQQQK